MNDNIKVDFIGIGAAKCATTWVHKCLLEHPQICLPYVKESFFFVTKPFPSAGEPLKEFKPVYNKGTAWYLERFDHCPAKSIKGELSALYLTDPGASYLIKQYFPDVKILVFLRDPVKRAYSHYWFKKKVTFKEKKETFEEAIKNNYEAYIDGGMYYRHLRKYYDIFPKENIGIFWVDDLEKDPVRFIQSVYGFLGVDNSFIPPSARRRTNAAREIRSQFLNRTIDSLVYTFYKFLKFTRLHFLRDVVIGIGLQKGFNYILLKVNVKSFDKPLLDPTTEEMLRKLYLEDIRNLEKLTTRDLSAWKRGADSSLP